MTVVRDILKEKGRQVHHISPEASLLDALKVMAESTIGALFVLDGDQLAGIVSGVDTAVARLEFDRAVDDSCRA